MGSREPALLRWEAISGLSRTWPDRQRAGVDKGGGLGLGLCMKPYAIAELWAELISAVVGAVLGWFTRHYQQDRPTRPNFFPNDRKERRKIK